MIDWNWILKTFIVPDFSLTTIIGFVLLGLGIILLFTGLLRELIGIKSLRDNIGFFMSIVGLFLVWGVTWINVLLANTLLLVGVIAFIVLIIVLFIFVKRNK